MKKDLWDKKELLNKYPIRNPEFISNYVLGYGDAYWYPGMPSKIVTYDGESGVDPWNRAWEDGTKWKKYDPYKDTQFRWVNVDGKKIDVYLVRKNYNI